jgi:hypothetical protein
MRRLKPQVPHELPKPPAPAPAIENETIGVNSVACPASRTRTNAFFSFGDGVNLVDLALDVGPSL